MSPVLPRYQAASVAVHVALVGMALWMFSNSRASLPVRHRLELIEFPRAMRPWIAKAAGGGGGAQQKLAATQGQLPKPARKVFVAPAVETFEAKLMVAASILAPPETPLPQADLNNWGDPLAKFVNGSAGTGKGLSIGNGDGPAVGDGKGVVYGSGEGEDFGPIFASGQRVSRPVLIVRVDPEYSEEARKAKYSGVVLLDLVVDTTGHARNIRVVRSLGLGLDEKAIEAVSRWRFRPGTSGGAPVNVRAKVEVNFRLL